MEAIPYAVTHPPTCPPTPLTLLVKTTAGTLTVEAIPYAATHPDNITLLANSTGLRLPPFSALLAWNASMALDLLPAAANASGGGRSTESTESRGSPTTDKQLGPGDLFLRLRFCPTRVAPAEASYHSPFFAPEPPPGAAAALQLPAGAPGGEEGGGSERAAAGSDGSNGSEGGGSGGTPCPGAAAQLAGGASGPGACAAAQRLLQCSEAFLFLSELKDASLAQGEVGVESVEWVEQGPEAAGGGEAPGPAGSTNGTDAGPAGAAGSSQLSAAQAAALRDLSAGAGASDAQPGPAHMLPLLAVRLNFSTPFLPLFVALESPLEGVFLENGVHLLPWGDRTLRFALRDARCGAPKAGAGAGAAAGGPAGCTPQEREAVVRDFQEGLQVRWLQQAMGVEQARQGAAGVAAASSAPEGGEPQGGEGAGSASQRASPPGRALWAGLLATALAALLL